MTGPDGATHAPRQIACDLAYAASAIALALAVHAAVASHPGALFAWTGVLPAGIRPWAGLGAGVAYLVTLMCLPILWAICWPPRLKPSAVAILGAFLIFNGLMVFAAAR